MKLLARAPAHLMKSIPAFLILQTKDKVRRKSISIFNSASLLSKELQAFLYLSFPSVP